MTEKSNYFRAITKVSRALGTTLDRDEILNLIVQSAVETMRGKAASLFLLDEEKGTMVIDGIPVTILRETRNPKEIPWREHGVKLVVDATGKYTDPTAPPDARSGSARGHLEAGAEKVIVSAPFKIREKGVPFPDDAVTLIAGINDNDYEWQSFRHIGHALPTGRQAFRFCRFKNR